MQTSNSTGQDTRYTVESGRGPDDPRFLRLLGNALDNSYELGPNSYAPVSLNGTLKGKVNFFVQENGNWVFAASGEFSDQSALVTLMGRPGDYRVQVAYPQLV